MHGPAQRILRHLPIRSTTSTLTTAVAGPSRLGCPACIRTQQARSYAARPQQSRTRRSTSEFSSRQAAPSTSRSGPSSAEAPFRARYAALSADFGRVTVIQDMLQAVFPLIFRRELRSLPDHDLLAISETLATLVQSSGDLTDEEVRQAMTVMGHCWTRSNAVKGTFSLRYTEVTIHRLEDNYARIIRLLVDRRPDGPAGVERLSRMAELVSATLERSAKMGVLVPGSVAAAQAHLLAQCDSLRIVSGSDQMSSKSVEGLSGSGGPDGDVQMGRTRRNGPAPSTDSQDYPTTRPEIEKALHRARAEGGRSIVDLWYKVRPRLLPGQTDSTSSLPPDDQSELLVIFLRALKRPVLAHKTDRSFTALTEAAFIDALSCMPRPLSRTAAQAMLALRARPEGSDLRAGHEVISLDDEVGSEGGISSIGDLKSTWGECGEKDLKMYMIYMEGLGRMGDIDALKEAWNELVRDETCKRIYLAENGLPSHTAFPPVTALNQMISAALLVPTEGPRIALDLFAQACMPTSVIPANLITINTVLRHHARQADLPAMSALFTLAEKSGLKPDVVTYTTLVQGLLRAQRLELAKRVLEDMHQQGISPNERMYSMLIADLAKSGTKVGLEHAEELLKLMRRRGFETNEVTWTGLIAGYFRGGWEADAWDAIERMKRAGHALNRVGWNMLLRQSASVRGASGTIGIWRGLLEQGISPNSDTYLIALTPLVMDKRWTEAEEVIREMQARKFRVEKGALATIVSRVKSRR
ncbi:hypothetical protein IAU60_001703 [Kwoniella sp. DSM 27419]